MNVLLDTSVLVAALVGTHPLHERAFTWLRQASSGKITLLVAAHALVELYAVLTRYPSTPKISPEQAARLIMSSVAKHATIIPLGVADHVSVIQELAARGLPGGIIYDALHVRAAMVGRAQKIVSFNRADFERLLFLADSELTVP
ncbi:type II toxin-antitoxin system VapC family toxin [Desulfolutivibrio sulfoxidireducens]|uniref:type II toxin-antitoxin system VapC family toxin n=1 Tax=Desulfolutivibrio sulfoxidireducens TaxID=2773299 RepID=UPI00159D64E3|nr:PIN domain-containing protein [Desulfolutivibrio sulfoxidireducens]QLA14711.1 PIN domain-containing protein [Desulfolutivibrio sulfoxidireducens]QLA18293.1 PIN domain-containing protein [Desulfolutivibrio sulfoxidireducens]